MPQRNGNDVLRRCRFAPYVKGAGPTFALIMWDTGRTDSRGQTTIEYRLTMTERGAWGKRRVRDKAHWLPPRRVTLFHGTDFTGSPLHADDSNATVASLMNFLTLRPGDTDREYFANYSPTQLNFANHHAESLAMCAMARFGEGN